jgi:hypothetical protein
MYRIEMSPTVRLALLAALLIAASMAIRPVFADANTGTTGQPNQSCQTVFGGGPPFPSPAGFNTAGFNNASLVYAGSGQNTNTPANSNAVSQYDVACFQTANHVP